MLRGRRRQPARGGATLVEAAFVLSGILLFVFAIFDYGRFLMVRHIADNAAREGARLAVIANTGDTNSFNYQTTTTVQAAVRTAFAGQDKAVTGLNIQVYPADASGNAMTGSWVDAQYGQNIAVQIDASYTPLLGGIKLPFMNTQISLLPATLPIHAKAVMSNEDN